MALLHLHLQLPDCRFRLPIVRLNFTTRPAWPSEIGRSKTE